MQTPLWGGQSGKSQWKRVCASQLRPLKELNDNFSDERRGKTNAVLSDFTSIIHLLNAARTMRTKMACVKWSLWAQKLRGSAWKTQVTRAEHLCVRRRRRRPRDHWLTLTANHIFPVLFFFKQQKIWINKDSVTWVKRTHRRKRNTAEQQHLVTALLCFWSKLKSHFYFTEIWHGRR